MKNRFLVFFVVFFFFLTALPSLTLINAQKLTLSDKKEVYDLPYPGILPDHPLYFIKSFRDTITEFLTREPMKKAELLLHNSDKKVSMAIQLVDKGKSDLAIETTQEAEQMINEIPAHVATSKERGVGPTDTFKNKLLSSNAKHREVYESLLKKLPQGGADSLRNVIEQNQKNRQALQKIK